MGAKGLKAIVVDDAGIRNVDAAARDEYRQAVLDFSRTVLEDPRTVNMSGYGTAGVIRFVNRDSVASMPTRNHRLGVFPQADAISGQRIAEMAPERSGKMLPCMAGCIIKCAILFNNAKAEHVTSALEFETIALMGPNLEIGDIDAIARLDRLCDDIGLDTIEMGNAIGVALEAGVAPFGDWQRVADLLEEVRQGTSLGRILGAGVVLTAQAFNIDRVPAVKGQGLPAWEPRTLKGMGITYATSPQGADHTAGLVTARNVTPDSLLKASRHPLGGGHRPVRQRPVRCHVGPRGRAGDGPSRAEGGARLQPEGRLRTRLRQPAALPARGAPAHPRWRNGLRPAGRASR
jgi:aldehyde:ferredoxin oxidoreductase